MGNPRCPACGSNMVKNGRAKAGRTRFRCMRCGSSPVRKIDTSAKALKAFLGWLLSRKRQSDMPGGGRTFRRKCAPFWNIWPMPPRIEEPRSVVHVDGIHLGRKAVVLVASDERHALGWHLCRTENSRGWAALMQRIAAPEMVVSDGGDGFQKALGKTWPRTPHQRCVFHAFSQVKCYTTSRPRTRAGVELYGLAKALLAITTLGEAQECVEAFLAWSERWDDFLSERTRTEDGRFVLTHERLVKARRSLARLVNAGTLFTYLDPRLEHLAPLPSTNNRIEGGVNSQLRAMLRDHRGLSVERRLKAVFWWCYMHSPSPLPAAEILRVMPTDGSIRAIYERLNQQDKLQGTIPQWGDAIAWSELHHSQPLRMDWD
ncbi:IS1249 family transposase [Thermophilibacter provencensis]|uniref:IS1249 family transposase n=1 Tax=Thermophilibacter provencensis TaxID=1852386 RepID=A0ABT7V404_9ACTN|nr:IS1249 family transposase [Thermophilibacter provencensis]MDM8270728.1 IS1249 family transposase [Thermophilibacter provencensis]MDM8270729.1 IS1249 family transposase [Thermophilibacter provencensis]